MKGMLAIIERDIRKFRRSPTLILISMFFLPQSFHWLVVPICLMLLIRTGTISKAK